MYFISYNIHMAMRLPVILEEFQKRNIMEEIGILCLQEATEKDGKNTCEKIMETFPHIPFAYRFEPLQLNEGEVQANAILWRKDIFEELDYRVIELPKPAPNHGSLARKLFGKRLVLERKVCQSILLRYHTKTVRILNTHLDALRDWVHIANQTKTILTAFRRQSRGVDAAILCGDFNTLTFGFRDKKHFFKLREFFRKHRFHDISDDIHSTYQFRTQEVKKFVVSPFFFRFLAFLRVPARQKLDWVLVYSKGKERFMNSTKAIPMEGSDHLPLIAEMKL